MADQPFKSITVSSTTAAVQVLDSVSGNFYVTAFAAHASSNNTGSVYLVNSSDESTNGYELIPGQREDWSYVYAVDEVAANNFFIWGGTTGDIVTVTAVVGSR